MPTRLLPAAGLSAALLLGACQNPDGSTNWGNTLLLGAGVGTAAALIAGAASDNPRPRYYRGGPGGYRTGYYGGPPRGYYGSPGYYGRPGYYRGW